MYGNYSHFMKFPTGFGGECFTRLQRRDRLERSSGDGEIRITGLGLNWEGGHVCLSASIVCFRGQSFADLLVGRAKLVPG